MSKLLDEQSLQERYAPQNHCYGCGPANELGLRIRSFARDDGEVVCEWQPQKHHGAFPGMLNGGVIGSLIDCHANWTAAWYLMGRDERATSPPCTVTAEYSVKLLRPTPTDSPVSLSARVVEATEDRVQVEVELMAGGKICATGRGTFIAVKLGHPAYNRW